ncbi:signal peptidase I [archaeon]|jgi:signal peptidase I|nr:signal peptidase I [archaeon]MDP6548432.1 signal peptidase I [Candidatus Woesearchaeota archaeon]|tara:strand:+ start:2717 stop:3313 length:597 start_codon:yes stop_codon:yes gene_type:complete
MTKKKTRKLLKKTWHFIWEEDSLWSWIVNVILAFILIKFIVYPGLGLLLSTSHPVVAVVSESMEHNEMKFDGWWDKNNNWYIENSITKDQFEKFSLKNGFNKGDIMILAGKDAENIAIGDVIVFRSNRKDPIIHRVVKKTESGNLQTKGDNNKDSIKNSLLDETDISEDRIIGKAVLKIPYLGYIKIGFVEILNAGLA